MEKNSRRGEWAAEGEIMGLYQYEIADVKKTDRIDRLIANLFAKMPEIESAGQG